MVSQIGGYGNFSQAVRDSLSAGWKAEGGLGGNLLGLFKAAGSADAQGGRTAMEEVSADTLRLGVQKEFRQIMGQDKSAEWKAQQITSFMHSAYDLMERHGEMKSAQQLLNGADNPLKKSPVGDPRE